MSRKIRLKLGADERDVLRRLPAELMELLDGDPTAEPVLKRLFPPAYVTSGPDTQEFEAEYRRLMGGDLVDRHRASLQVLLETVDAKELTDEQAHAWVVGLNELRLVLGTVLDVQEGDDEGPADSPQYALYHYLTYLQGWLIDQLEP